MVGIKDEEWEAFCRTVMFPDLGNEFWGGIQDDTLARRSRQIAREKKFGRKRITFTDNKKTSEGFYWAVKNLKPMPLLREDSIGRIHRYEYDQKSGHYTRVGVVAEKISLDQLFYMRMEIMEQFDAETKGEKNGI